jgi:hypothetical protein
MGGSKCRGVEMIRSLNVGGKTHTRHYGYGFSTGPNSRTHTHTRGKTCGKPVGYPYPCSTLHIAKLWIVMGDLEEMPKV